MPRLRRAAVSSADWRDTIGKCEREASAAQDDRDVLQGEDTAHDADIEHRVAPGR